MYENHIINQPQNIWSDFVDYSSSYYSFPVILFISFTLSSMLSTVIFIYWIYFVPKNWIREPTEITYNFATSGIRKSALKKEVIHKIQRLRKIGDHHLIPPPYPNGWYALIESKKVKIGQILEVSCLGEHFAIFRNKANEIRVLNAYCPHMGANIAIGGEVIGDSVQCPFHGWRFSGLDGQCVNVPYSSCSSGPKSAKLKKWISKEVNEAIFIWYHADDEEPWNLPIVDEIDTKQFVYHGRNEFFVNCHIQEIPENGADLAHFAAVHQDSLLGGNDPKGKWLSILGTHSWKASWQVNTEPKHTAIVSLKHSLVLNFGPLGTFKLCRMDVSGKQIGPSYVHLQIMSPFGPIVVIQTVTPIEPVIQKVIHRFYAPRYTAPYVKFVIIAESIMFERDMNVWNHKTFAHSPCLVKEDKAINIYRNWFSQFYSENSRTFAQTKETLDW